MHVYARGYGIPFSLTNNTYIHGAAVERKSVDLASLKSSIRPLITKVTGMSLSLKTLAEHKTVQPVPSRCSPEVWTLCDSLKCSSILAVLGRSSAGHHPIINPMLHPKVIQIPGRLSADGRPACFFFNLQSHPSAISVSFVSYRVISESFRIILGSLHSI